LFFLAPLRLGAKYDSFTFLSMKTQPAGIYIHVPFCIRKCRYCDFYSSTDLKQRSDFINALQREIALAPDPGPADSFYFGGGTPSLLDPKQVAAIVAAVRERFTLGPDAEITLEANPGTVDRQTLADFRAAGVNRLNLGIQSFKDQQLEFLGRIHTAVEANQAIEAARTAGFNNLGLDLIYGLPGQTTTDLRRDVEHAAVFQPEHLSCYLLTYEKGTPLEKDREQAKVDPLPESDAATLFMEIRDLLAASGYRQYEISNFARAAHYRSRHNRKYWNGAPYVGLGPAAHSYLEPVRYWNHRELKPYLEDLEKGRLPVRAKETLTPGQQMIEAIYLGLRQTRGISLAAFNQKFAVDFTTLFDAVLTDSGLKSLLEVADDYCRLTPQGMLVMDTVVGRFVDVIPF
jgi:oxygen-independent coproporphyrinogen-3 oxidase